MSRQVRFFSCFKFLNKNPSIFSMTFEDLIFIEIISKIFVIIEINTKISFVFVIIKVSFIVKISIEQFKKIIKFLINLIFDVNIKYVF